MGTLTVLSEPTPHSNGYDDFFILVYAKNFGMFLQYPHRVWYRGAMPRWPVRTVVERFMAQVEVAGTCWLWKGKRHKYKGYGYFKLTTGKSGGKHIIAHRFAYMQFVGPIPDDRPVLDHLCLVRRCVNPSHLEPVTVAENNRRAARVRHGSV
jgi:hypothetical protein